MFFVFALCEGKNEKKKQNIPCCRRLRATLRKPLDFLSMEQTSNRVDNLEKSSIISTCDISIFDIERQICANLNHYCRLRRRSFIFCWRWLVASATAIALCKRSMR